MPLSDSVNVTPASRSAAARIAGGSGIVTAISYMFAVARFRDSRPPENHARPGRTAGQLRRGGGAVNARRPDRLTFTQPPVPSRKGTGEGARIVVGPEKTWTSSLVPLP